MTAKRKKTRTVKLLSVAILCVLLISAAIMSVLFFINSDGRKYNNAEKLLSSGNIDAAREIFLSLGDYSDCSEKVTECDYRSALILFEQEDWHNAKTAFDAIVSYRDSSGYSSECEYKIAGDLFDSNNYESARSAFISLGTYKDSFERAVACVVAMAGEAIENGSYTEARDLLAGIDTSAHPPEYIAECNYLEAVDFYNSGKYKEAMTLFSELGAYKDSNDRYAECIEGLYHNARILFNRLKFEEAAEVYTLLGSYKDSVECLEQCNYQIWYRENSVQNPLIKESSVVSYYESGCIYNVNCGIAYVPKEVNEDTKYLVYYSGGTGLESWLYMEGLVPYFNNFSPNAVILFFYTSGFNDMHAKDLLAIETISRISYETGAEINEVAVCGSSHGCFTAMRACAELYTEGGFKVSSLTTLDVGSEWNVDDDVLLSDEECAVIAANGTKFYLFEQMGVGTNYPAIARLVEKGIDTTIVECFVGDHNLMSVHAYDYGIFSWQVGEFELLNPTNYTFIKLNSGEIVPPVE